MELTVNFCAEAPYFGLFDASTGEAVTSCLPLQGYSPSHYLLPLLALFRNRFVIYASTLLNLSFFSSFSTHRSSQGLALGKVVCLVGQTDSPRFGCTSSENIARFPLNNPDVLDAQWECSTVSTRPSTCQRVILNSSQAHGAELKSSKILV